MFYVGFDIGKCHHEVGVIDDKGQIPYGLPTQSLVVINFLNILTNID